MGEKVTSPSTGSGPSTIAEREPPRPLERGDLDDLLEALATHLAHLPQPAARSQRAFLQLLDLDQTWLPLPQPGQIRDHGEHLLRERAMSMSKEKSITAGVPARPPTLPLPRTPGRRG